MYQKEPINISRILKKSLLPQLVSSFTPASISSAFSSTIYRKMNPGASYVQCLVLPIQAQGKMVDNLHLAIFLIRSERMNNGPVQANANVLISGHLDWL